MMDVEFWEGMDTFSEFSFAAVTKSELVTGVSLLDHMI